MDKVYNIDEIFGCTNVKVQAIPTEHLGCSGCFFNKTKSPYCFRPAFIPSCVDKERKFIFIKINNEKILLTIDVNPITNDKSLFVSIKDALPE